MAAAIKMNNGEKQTSPTPEQRKSNMRCNEPEPARTGRRSVIDSGLSGTEDIDPPRGTVGFNDAGYRIDHVFNVLIAHASGER